jgi:anti-sigma factor RsiW
MNCSQAQADLASLVYGDLTAEDAGRVQEHLATCLTCRQASETLQHLRRLLDAVPAPTCPAPPVDMSRLYREAAGQQERRLRRWRRLALVLGGVAAAVAVLAVGLRLDVRLEAHQVVVRWGTPPAAVEAPPAPNVPVTPEAAISKVTAESPPPSAGVEEQVRIVSELVQLLATDLEARDQRQQQALARLQARLQILQQQNAQWRLATEHDMDALYAAQFGQAKKGKLP